MKRSWMLALFLTGTLAVLTAPASAKENGDVAATSVSASDQDTSVEALREDINTALGTQASRLNAIEKQLGLKISGMSGRVICSGASCKAIKWARPPSPPMPG